MRNLMKGIQKIRNYSKGTADSVIELMWEKEEMTGTPTEEEALSKQVILQNKSKIETKCTYRRVIKKFKFFNYIVYYKLDYYERLMYNNILNIKEGHHYYVRLGYIPRINNIIEKKEVKE